MKFNIITIFPDVFDSYFSESILGRAQQKKLVDFEVHNLRDFTQDKHKKTDDEPYGGGSGMVMLAEPIIQAVEKIAGEKSKRLKSHKVILMSAKGNRFNQKMATDFSGLDSLTIICGRYEGVDERVAQYVVDEEVSIGDYVLTGGELPAMIIADAVTRLIPGVITKDSLNEESFSEEGLLEYPHYTRPEEIEINGKKRSTRGFNFRESSKDNRMAEKQSEEKIKPD